MSTLNKFLKLANYEELFLISVFVITPLLFVNDLQDTILLPRLFFLTLVTFIITTYFLLKKEQPGLIVRHPLVYLFLCFILLTALSSYGSINKAESIFEASKVILSFTIFLFFIQLFSLQLKSIIIFTKCIVTSVIIHGLIMISEFFIDKITLSNYQSLCEFSALMGNKNIFGEYMLCCLPICFYSFWISNRLWKALSFLGIFLIIVSSVFLQTRSVWVAAFIVAIAVLVLVSSQRKNFDFSLGRISKKFLVLSAFPLLALFIFLSTNSSTRVSIVDRIQSITQVSKNGSAKGRLVLWEKSLKLFSEHPITGVGAGNWKIAFQKYGQEYPSKVFNVRVMNDFLLVLCETGIVGFIFFAALFLYSIIILIQFFLKSDDKLIKAQALTIFSSLALYMITSFFSFPKERPDSLILLSALLAISVALHLSKDKEIISVTVKREFILTPVFLFLVTIAFVLKYRNQGEYFLQKALDARKENRHGDVINSINDAENYLYTIDGSTTPISWYRGVARFQLNDSLALADFEKAYTYNPYHLHVLNNLATTLDHAGQQEKAIRYYREAISVSPHFLPAIVNLSILYYNQGNFVEAERTIKLWKGKRLTSVRNLRKIIHAKAVEVH